MKIIKFLTSYSTLFLYLLLSVVAILPFFQSGFFTFHDDVQVARVFVMSQALADGVFPVRIVEGLGYGYGYPIFNFYSTLPYYIGGFVANAGSDILTATKIVFSLVIVASGVSMYFLVREFFGKVPALVSSVIYLYFPYHAVNIFVRGDLAEATSYVFFPLVFLGLFKLYGSVDKDGNPKLPIVLTSISVAGVVISHNLSAFMLFIFVGLFIILALIANKKRKVLFIYYVLSLFIAFLLSAFYAIPAVLEMGYTNVLSQVGGGSHYEDHFVCLPQLWDSIWGFGGSAPGCIDGISFKIGKLNVILVLISLVLFVINFRKDGHKLFLTGLSFVFLFLSVFLVLPFSVFIWHLPYMDFLQFPWRFINFIGLFTAFVIGYMIWALEKKFKLRIAYFAALVIIGGTLFFNAKLFIPQEYIDRDESFYTNSQYLNWTASKISDEYLPRNFKTPESQSEVKESVFEIAEDSGNVSLVDRNSTYISGRADLPEERLVRINIAYFPAWKVFIDSQNVGYIVRNDGMYVRVPQGRHLIEVRFVETLVEKSANWISVIGVVALVLVIIGKPVNLLARVRNYGKKAS